MVHRAQSTNDRLRQATQAPDSIYNNLLVAWIPRPRRITSHQRTIEAPWLITPHSVPLHYTFSYPHCPDAAPAVDGSQRSCSSGSDSIILSIAQMTAVAYYFIESTAIPISFLFKVVNKETTKPLLTTFVSDNCEHVSCWLCTMLAVYTTAPQRSRFFHT